MDPTHPILALQDQLAEGQWHAPERVQALQRERLVRVLDHAKATVPFYRERLADHATTGPLDLDWFQGLPVLSRKDVQAHFEALQSGAVPSGHGTLLRGRSSGSTGTPVEIVGTAYDAQFARALLLRSHLWSDHDFSGHLAAIKKLSEGTPERAERWGSVASFPFLTGPASFLDIGVAVGVQLDWLVATGPDYLITYPSNLHALCEEALRRQTGIETLRHVMCMAESLATETRELCREAFGVEIADAYSAEEVGLIALQCPEREVYHVQSEAMVLELLREDGGACEPGEMGHVTVTPLHNYAMPLVRYQLGDLAVAGGPCTCGRGLPVLERVLGRTRNLLQLADGSRVWPSFGSRRLREIAPIVQHQFVQDGIDRLTARLVVERVLVVGEERALRDHLASRLPDSFDIHFEYPGFGIRAARPRWIHRIRRQRRRDPPDAGRFAVPPCPGR